MSVRKQLAAAAVAAAAVGVVAGFTGCGVLGIPVGQHRGPEAEPAPAVDCLSEPTSRMLQDPQATETSAPRPEPGRVPKWFDAASALLCSIPSPSADRAVDTATITRYEGDLGPLLEALDAPDDVAGPNQACTADLQIVPSLWLEAEDGTLIPVHWPRNVCGKTKPGAGEALGNLEQVETVEVPLG